MHFDYTTVGHVTIDVMPDGTRRPGGGAFYSALQAARLGLRTLIVTQGVEDEIRAAIGEHLGELELTVTAAPSTTTMRTSGFGSSRRQCVAAWAGPMREGLLLDTSILHLAPVARESPGSWAGRAGFVGITPQGLCRAWDGPDAEIRPVPVREATALVGARCDGVVVSERERQGIALLIERALAAGATVAITDEAGPNRIIAGDGAPVEVPVPQVEDPRDDLGAGDVFAAAFFSALQDGEPPERAAAFANAAAAVRMGGMGAGAVGDRAAIDARLNAVAAP